MSKKNGSFELFDVISGSRLESLMTSRWCFTVFSKFAESSFEELAVKILEF